MKEAENPDEATALSAGPAWGFMVENEFVEIPKLPCVRAGYLQPPFDVELPGGQIRKIIERPADD